MTSVSERFLKYVSYYTTSDEFSETCPSTDRQKVLGKYIADRVLTLPLYADLAIADVDRICDLILR